MREFLEIHIDNATKHLFYTFHRGKKISEIWWLLEIDTSTFWFKWTKFLDGLLRRIGSCLIYGWNYIRIYSQKEIQEAYYFQIQIRTFMLTGEECGTIYDESSACPVCGSGAKLLSPLKLRRSKIPKADMSMTIAGGDEVIVSERFVKMVRENNLSGMDFYPVYSSGQNGHELNYYQIRPQHYMDFSDKTIFGKNPFNLSGIERAWTTVRMRKEDKKYKEYKEYHPRMIYKCPNGDNMGLNILSEAFIKSTPILNTLDFFASKQTVGGREGLIRPHHLFFCSNRMMRLIKEYKLKGFKFEVAHIVEE